MPADDPAGCGAQTVRAPRRAGRQALLSLTRRGGSGLLEGPGGGESGARTQAEVSDSAIVPSGGTRA